MLPSDDAAPLVVLLHGWDQTAGDMRPLADGLAGWLATAVPEGVHRTPQGRRSWLSETDGPAEAAAGVLDWLDTVADADRRVGLLGFSQGARVVAELLRVRPDRFVAAVLCAGYLEPGEDTPAEALGAERPATLCQRGAADWIVIPERGERLRAWLARHTALTSRIYPGVEHTVDEVMLDDANAFLGRHLR